MESVRLEKHYQSKPNFEPPLMDSGPCMVCNSFWSARFVIPRSADYLGLTQDHPLRFGIDLGGEWDSHIPLLHPDDHARNT